MNFVEAILWLGGAVLFVAILAVVKELYDALKGKRKLDFSDELQRIADMLVNAAEQIGKVSGWTNEQKKNYVMQYMREYFPGVPEFILEAAVEAVVGMLNRWTDLPFATEAEDAPTE